MLKKLLQSPITRDFAKTSFGNIIEWYDFSLYGLFAIQIAHEFFATTSAFFALLLVFSTFAVGFVSRPLGSIVFGMIGDRWGSHYAVNLSIWFMAIPTTLIGLLPNYHSIGVCAPIVLVILRLLQGLSAGGQFSGLIVIAANSRSKNKPFLVSLIYAVAVIGGFIASLIGYFAASVTTSIAHSMQQAEHAQHLAIINSISHSLGYIDYVELLHSLSWRIPFVLSFFVFIVYNTLKPDFVKHKHIAGVGLANDNVIDCGQFELAEVFRRQPQELLAMFFLSAASVTLYYLLFSYLITYLQMHLSFTKNHAFLFINIILLVSIFLYLLFGYMANSFSCVITIAKKMLYLFVLAVGIFAFSRLSFWCCTLGIVLMVISFCGITACTTSLFALLFAKSYRMTACSFSYNAGVTVAGFSPLVAELISKEFKYGLALLLFLISLVLFFTLRIIKRLPSYRRLYSVNN